MSISSEITRLENAKAAIAAAIAEKGVTVPDGTLLDGMAALIEGIQAGGVTIEFGTHTPTTTTSLDLPYKIDHNLGYVPDIFFLYSVTYEASYNIFCIVARFKYLLLSETGDTFGSYAAGKGASNVLEGSIRNNQPTANSVWIRSGSNYHRLGSGQTYRWFAIGGLS